MELKEAIKVLLDVAEWGYGSTSCTAKEIREAIAVAEKYISEEWPESPSNR